MAFILISERPSFLQEVLRSNYDKDPFTKPVSAMIGTRTSTRHRSFAFASV